MPSTSGPPAERLLTPGQAATMLYVHARTVARWAKAGKLSSVLTPGGHRRFALSEVLRVRSDHNSSNDPPTDEQVSSRAHDSATADAALSVSRTAAEAVAPGL